MMSEYVWDKHEKKQQNKQRKEEIRKRKTKLEVIKKKKKIEKKTSQKKRKKILYIIVIIFIFSQLFVQYFEIKNIEVSPTYLANVNTENITKEYGLRMSIFDFLKIEYNTEKNEPYFKKVKTSYSFKDKTLNIQVDEVKTIGYDEDGKFYYFDDEEIITQDQANIVAPTIIGLDDVEKKNIANELILLNYEILSQIITITPHENENTVIMYMNSGQTVEIKIDQISDKMPYYLQIEAVIDESADGKSGIIHLDVGDYYEPK